MFFQAGAYVLATFEDNPSQGSNTIASPTLAVVSPDDGVPRLQTRLQRLLLKLQFLHGFAQKQAGAVQKALAENPRPLSKKMELETTDRLVSGGFSVGGG